MQESQFNMVLRALILALMLTALAASAVGQAFPTASAETDTGEVYETRHSHVLAFPKYVWNALTYPVGQLTIRAEHKGLFANRSGREPKTFGLLPYGVLGGEMGGNLGGETGIAGGFTMFHSNLFGRGNGFSARLIANRSNFSGHVRFEDPGIGGGPWYWNASVEALDTRNKGATINGRLRGSGSRLDYKQRDSRITLGRHSNYGETEGYEPDTIVELRLSHGFRQFDDIDRLPSDIVGANEAINLFSVGGRVAFDDRDFKPPTASISHPLNYQLPGRVLLFAEGLYYSFRDTAFPEHGGLARIEADYVAGSGNVRYLHYAAGLQRFFTLFFKNRILALRARLDKTHALGDDSIIPYSDLATLGGTHRLRGYRRGSFRGEGTLLFSAEYRYPIRDTWNAFLFWDEGQVFDQYGDLGLNQFEYSFGAGISVRTERAFLFGLRIARSKEEEASAGFSLEKEF